MSKATDEIVLRLPIFRRQRGSHRSHEMDEHHKNPFFALIEK